jgi:hypothetical protein
LVPSLSPGGCSSALPQLNLSSNMLKDRAIVSLMKGFEANRSLKELDVSYNLWEDVGASAIGKMLVRCPMRMAD